MTFLGAENQSCPVLVLADGPREVPAGISVWRAGDRCFIEGARAIGAYLARVLGIPELY
ncbi:MAG: DUF3088 family protein [Opitutaceae bacterium]|nr:DUF3088 family protein [Opitutaceae bacterium]